MSNEKQLPPIPTATAEKEDIGTLVKAALMMIADNGGVQKFELTMMNGKGEPRMMAVVVMPDIKRAQDFITGNNIAPTPPKRIKLIGVDQ